KWISASGRWALMAPAMARAGLMWPAVPPAAMSTRMLFSPLESGFVRAEHMSFPRGLFFGLARLALGPGLVGRPADAEHHAHFAHQQQKAGAAGGEEGQADTGVGDGVG